MKKCITLAVMLLMSAVVVAQAPSSTKISLADARSRIDKVVSSPELMKETMKQLSAEDQKTFLAEVNKAIGEMPGSAEEKAALFLSANLAAVSSAEKGNSATLLAETFATVSPEALPVISEVFSDKLVNRMEGSNAAFNDAQYEKIAVETIGAVDARCEETDNGTARTTFAILMFLRASPGTSETLENSLVNVFKNDDSKDLARECLEAALGKNGREQSYEPLVAAADAGHRVDLQTVLVIAGPQYATAVLADSNGKITEPDTYSQTQTPVLDAVENVFGQQGVRIGNDKPGAAGANGGAVHGGVIEAGGIGGGPGGKDMRPTPVNPDPQETGHSPIKPYPFQTFAQEN